VAPSSRRAASSSTRSGPPAPRSPRAACADEIGQPDQVGVGGQRIAGQRRLGDPGRFHQDLGGLHRPEPGAGEHEGRGESRFRRSGPSRWTLRPLSVSGRWCRRATAPDRAAGVGVADEAATWGEGVGVGVGTA
jgi:hypothetical protein